LDSDLLNSTSSSAGLLGGDVAALKLNIDFSDAAVIPHNANVAFGDLRLCSLSLAGISGMTVRDFATIPNTMLGGGGGPYTFNDIDLLLAQLNIAALVAGFLTRPFVLLFIGEMIVAILSTKILRTSALRPWPPPVPPKTGF
jgi:hypothetical protein